MSKRQRQKELELFKQCDEILYYVWDPIGCDGNPAARDEYSSYVKRTVELLLAEKSEEELANHLLQLQMQHMGMKPDPERAEKAADLLVGSYKWIFGN